MIGWRRLNQRKYKYKSRVKFRDTRTRKKIQLNTIRLLWIGSGYVPCIYRVRDAQSHWSLVGTAATRESKSTFSSTLYIPYSLGHSKQDEPIPLEHSNSDREWATNFSAGFGRISGARNYCILAASIKQAIALLCFRGLCYCFLGLEYPHR